MSVLCPNAMKRREVNALLELEDANLALFRFAVGIPSLAVLVALFTIMTLDQLHIHLDWQTKVVFCLLAGGSPPLAMLYLFLDPLAEQIRALSVYLSIQSDHNNATHKLLYEHASVTLCLLQECDHTEADVSRALQKLRYGIPSAARDRFGISSFIAGAVALGNGDEETARACFNESCEAGASDDFA